MTPGSRAHRPWLALLQSKLQMWSCFLQGRSRWDAAHPLQFGHTLGVSCCRAGGGFSQAAFRAEQPQFGKQPQFGEQPSAELCSPGRFLSPQRVGGSAGALPPAPDHTGGKGCVTQPESPTGPRAPQTTLAQPQLPAPSQPCHSPDFNLLGETRG